MLTFYVIDLAANQCSAKSHWC